MVIRNFTWQVFEPQKLMSYISNGVKSRKNTPSLFWNVPIPEHEYVVPTFEVNHQFRKLRKNSICIRHEIMAFSPKDSNNLSHEKIHTLARKYLELTYTNNVAYGDIHFDKDHYHIHLMITPNEYRQRNVTHINNERFHQVRRELETFQQKQFPELENSVVFINGKNKKKDQVLSKTHNEEQLIKRLGEKRSHSTKEFLHDKLMLHINQSISKDDFFSKLLQEQGIEIYHYRGKPNGIKYQDKKYRFTSLGISKQEFKALENKDRQIILERMKKLKKLTSNKEKSNELDLEL